MRESDELAAQVWITNESDVELSSVDLKLASPAFIKWLDGECPGTATRKGTTLNASTVSSEIRGPITLGSISAHSDTSRTLCAVTGSSIEVGSVNLLFTTEYSWLDKGQAHKSFVTTEKSLTVALFGTDSLAGVPLGIASLIVPGLLFWLALDWFKTPWGAGLALGDKLIYSVLVSAAILGLVSVLPDPLFSMRNGLSVYRLLELAGLGGVPGLLIGYAYDRHTKSVQTKNAAANAAKTVTLGDDPNTVLEKLLRLYAGKQIEKTIVILKDGRQFIGSLGQLRPDLAVLAGSFRVTTDGIQPDAVAAIDARFQKDGMLGLLEEAKIRKAKIELENNVRILKDDGQPGPTRQGVWYYKPDDIVQLYAVPVTSATDAKNIVPALRLAR